MDPDLEALAIEISETEKIPFAQALDAAAIELSQQPAYLAGWHAERSATWHALRAWAKDWDLMARATRIRQIIAQSNGE